MEIVTDFRELATDGLVQIPLLDEALDVSTIGAVEGILRVFAALFLSGPSECTVKVELVHSAEVASSLLDQVAKGHVRVRVHRRCDRVCIEVVGAEVTDAHVVVKGVTNFCLDIWGRRVATDEHIHNDLGLFIAGLEALVDSARSIDVVDGATIHKGAHTPAMVRKDEGDRC